MELRSIAPDAAMEFPRCDSFAVLREIPESVLNNISLALSSISAENTASRMIAPGR